MGDLDIHKPNIEVTLRKFSQAVRSLDPPPQSSAGRLFRLDGLGREPRREKDVWVQAINAQRAR